MPDSDQMSSTDDASNEGKRDRPFRVRLPGFAREEDIGLGSALKYASNRAGIKPCGGCNRRAAKLDRWVVFGGGKS